MRFSGVTHLSATCMLSQNIVECDTTYFTPMSGNPGPNIAVKSVPLLNVMFLLSTSKNFNQCNAVTHLFNSPSQPESHLRLQQVLLSRFGHSHSPHFFPSGQMNSLFSSHSGFVRASTKLFSTFRTFCFAPSVDATKIIFEFQ